MVYKKIKKYICSGTERSVNTKKNILGSVLNKGISVLISLLLVPATIDYLNTEQYGVWLTLSSIIGWISYFDVGLVHGFKNKFAEAKATDNYILARQYVSTTYACMAVVFGVLLLLVEFICPMIDWASILNIDKEYNLLLGRVCAILFFFICVHQVLNVISALLVADQKSAFSSMIMTIGQGLALVVICLLNLFDTKSMLYICLALSGLPCFVLFIITILCFKYKYERYSPSITQVRLCLVKDIIGLGGKFFIIQLSMLLIFQVSNIILTRVIGPDSVTVYNVTYKYFSTIQMLFNILLSPFWIAYTDAYINKDFEWMKRVYFKLNKVYYCIAFIGIIMLLVSPIVYKLWLPNYITISWKLSIAMCCYLLILCYSNMLMVLINGTGKVFLQMLVYVFCSLFAIPVMTFLCKSYAELGVIFVLGSVYILQSILAKIQLAKILNKSATGLWNK